MVTPLMAEMGGHGEEFEYTLELRTMADIGLVFDTLLFYFVLNHSMYFLLDWIP